MSVPLALLSHIGNFFTQAWLASLWRAAWQGGLAILLVWLVCRAWPAIPPRLRVWLWRLVYLKLLIAWLWAGTLTLNILPSMPQLPALKLTAQPAPPTAVTPQPAPVAPPIAVKTVAKAPAKATPAATPQQAALPAPAPSAAHRWQWIVLLPFLGAIWLFGILWGIIRLLLSMRLVHQLRREGHPVGEEALLRLRVQMVKQMGLRKAPMLLAHPTEGPLLLGMVHPVIIVPEAMLAGSEEELQLALAHELAHVRRRDILWGWLPVVAELLFFFHPLVYLARREYRLAQEIATDTQALHRTGAAPKAYGAMLVNGAAVQAGFRPVPVAVGIMESYLVLHRRLTAMKHVAISPRQYALAGILVCLLSLVSLVPWRLSAADFTPNIPPPPKQPVPNARELYIAANQKVIHPQVIFNRYTYNYEDINDMAQAGLQPGVGTMPDRGIMPVPPLETMQEITRANQPALDLLRKGFDVEYCEVPCRSFDTQFPHNAQFRNLTRALVADGYTRSCSGDWAGGMKSYLDGMRLGADPPHGGVYISMLVGIAIQSIARQPAWENVPHLSTAEAGIAAHRLETIMARHVPVADIVWEDKWSMEAGLLELLQKPDWRETLAKRWSIDDKGKARLKAISSSTILANIDRYMNALIEKAKLPYAAHDEPITVPDDPLCNSLSTSFRKIFFKDASNVSQNALLLVSLALQAYRAEHGNYPETLAELTPAYITAIPDDPFALQAPVCYKRAADGYLLYSIGPDGKDDGGMPCNGGQKAGDTGVVSEATGDIVAGINRY